VAMFVVGLEEDSTSADDVRKAKWMLQDYVKGKITGRIEEASGVSFEPNTALLKAKMSSIMEDSILQAWKMTPGTFPISLIELAAEAGDPDDYVGSAAMIYDFHALRRLMGNPVQRQLALEAEKAKDFEGRYVVHAEVHVTDVREQDPVKIA